MYYFSVNESTHAQLFLPIYVVSLWERDYLWVIKGSLCKYL